MDAFEILVIILSVTLAVFLVLAIIATSYLIAVLKKAKVISEHVENVAENVEEASAKFKSFAGPAAVMSLVTKLIRLRK